MNHFYATLQVYNDAGLRSSEDWEQLGRLVQEGATPRSGPMYRGKRVILFARSQTTERRKSNRHDAKRIDVRPTIPRGISKN